MLCSGVLRHNVITGKVGRDREEVTAASPLIPATTRDKPPEWGMGHDKAFYTGSCVKNRTRSWHRMGLDFSWYSRALLEQIPCRPTFSALWIVWSRALRWLSAVPGSAQWTGRWRCNLWSSWTSLLKPNMRKERSVTEVTETGKGSEVWESGQRGKVKVTVW